MRSKFPTPDEVRGKLQGLDRASLKSLSDSARVPFTTLLKIRSGETRDPQLSTVTAIWPELAKRRQPAKAA